MCCLVEKEMPLKDRQAYSEKTFDYPKHLPEKKNQYRVKVPSRVQGKFGKHTRSLLVVAPSAAEAGKGNPTVLDFIRANRPETIQIFSAVIAAAMILSLASSLLFGVHIVNPIPALLILVTFIGFFLMAKFAERFDVNR